MSTSKKSKKAFLKKPPSAVKKTTVVVKKTVSKRKPVATKTCCQSQKGKADLFFAITSSGLIVALAFFLVTFVF
ncbi:MAG: hypothetical protein UX09_C0025G0012 [Candidatus Uhrbacteria bacterium GW2011_GWE2_45_35]|uniref:Uncharacterized protein n=2 Tax=Candidatus Uhriibacteriota TaxID=1752732 RepID=A0A0G1JFC2_9BACT|nr:MAG: hypothetical protein UW63_C0028G0008 [Candidatus Uhrbacteria bacterium GW2011_GWF2_44_350]KKU07722.1 MAG: hypothetical protein UX09_C0025G0012 [Candidatus Uhrbacteria bacterium GW2011_GWE2_45_35]HBR80992.1 hypothetical protein [Candidatus Uhrbacteria bacterium]HCU31394.1 hypothetical protein [Candidatus Uhrbacteria bacterium]